MIEQHSYNGQPIDFSFEADLVSFDSDSPGIFAVAKALQAATKEYSLLSEGTLYMDNGEGVSISAQLTAAFNDAEEPLVSEFVVMLPLDRVVYVGQVVAGEEFILIQDERTLEFADAVEITKNREQSVLVLHGGTLTNAFEEQGIDVQEFDLDLDDYKTTKSITFNTLVFGGLGIAAVAVILLAVINLMLTDKIEAPVAILQDTMGQAILHKDVGSVATLLEDTNVFHAHGIERIEQKAPVRGVPFITITGQFRGTNYQRLESLSEKFETGEFLISGNTWSISSVRGSQNTATEEALRPFGQAIDPLLHVLRRYSNDIRFERPITNGDYTLVVSIARPNSSLLKRLSSDLSKINIHARLGSFTLETTEHAAWARAELQIYIRGSL